MMFIHQMGKDMLPYNGREKNKMRLIGSLAATVTMTIINRREK